MATLQEIRAKLKEQESKSGGSNSRTGGDNAIYPFWNLKEGEQIGRAHVRTPVTA